MGLYNDVANSKLRKILNRLSESGELAYLDKGRYRYQGKSGKTLTGPIQITKAGMGFLLVEGDGQDVLIRPNKLGKSMDGDTVKVRLLAPRKHGKGRVSGEVIEIVNRARTEFVGEVDRVGRTWLLTTDDPRIQTEFYIPSDKTKGAEVGDKVLTRLLNWDRRSPEVEVIQVLGASGEHDTEMHAILYHYGFDPKFPSNVEREAAAIKEDISAKEISKRRDFRQAPTFTIDPIDAKDFDDALSLRQLENGRYEVGVHIADVSHYVKPGTLVDKEAYKRGTSVYLVDRYSTHASRKTIQSLVQPAPEGR